MKKLMNFTRNLWMDEAGQGMVEYGLILALITVGAIAMLTSIGTKINTKYTNVDTAL